MVGRSNYGVLSEFALDMVVEAPKQIIFGHELYPIIWLKAAFILQKITKNTSFQLETSGLPSKRRFTFFT